MRLSVEDRFWTKVIRDPLGCWEWTACKTKKGYGHFRLGGKYKAAHRFVAECFLDDWDPNLFVFHRCDNPGCVRPSHLFMGTNSENIQDALQKGRWGNHKGSRNGRALLTEDDIKTIRSSYSYRSHNYRMLAEEYGVSKSAIALIVQGKHWKEVA